MEPSDQYHIIGNHKECIHSVHICYLSPVHCQLVAFVCALNVNPLITLVLYNYMGNVIYSR